LEIYCAARIESKSSNFAQKQLEKAKKKMRKRMSDEELENFYKLAKLQQKLAKLQTQEESSYQVQVLVNK
jgi:hypothetical protein